MRYRISEIKIDPRKVAADGGGISRAALERELDAEIRRTLSGRRSFIVISDIQVVRESVDARKKPNVKLVYTVDFECGSLLNLPLAETKEYFTPKTLVSPQKPRPVIAGFGPCGIFAALVLAEAGLRPIVIERGKAIDERVADVENFWNAEETAPDPESNVQFGEGGAGTFSDGKLTTGIKDIRIRKVLKSFVEAGAEPEILYRHKPHIGTDKLRSVVKNLRMKIEDMGGEVRFSTRLEGLDVSEGQLKAVRVVNTADGSSETIATENLILAIGHSARDTFEMLHASGFDMTPKAFSIGVRIEHPQTNINRAQYGDETLAEILGPAEYKMSYKCREDSGDETGGRGVYTFCMCPGGEVVNASTESETSVTNGMSNAARDGKFANSALLVDVRTSDFSKGDDNPLAGVLFQQRYEKLAWENRTERGMARCTYGQFENSDREERGKAVKNSLPAFASEAILEAIPKFGRKLKGFDDREARLTAVESRSSSPVRILRNKNMEISRNGEAVKGIIPAGEGPGYAGGIMSAAVDGIKAAEAIILGD